MMITIFGIAALSVALLAIALQRFYSSVPPKELKRLAARGDRLAQALYRPVAYGPSLRVLLWLVVVVAAPIGFLLLAQSLPATVAVLLMIAAVTLGFVYLPSIHLTVHSARFAVWTAPALAKILSYVHPALDGLAKLVNRYRSLQPHSGLYEKEDVAALLAQQQGQVDNRMSNQDLNLLHRVLHFGDKKAADIATPRKKLRLVDAHESLGPILLDELHTSGQPVFVVVDGKPDNLAGTLPMKYAAEAKAGSQVADLVRRDLCFVHEDFTLQQVANALMQTKQYVAVVLNNFNEFVGVITLERLMQEVFGQPENENLAYEDREAIANYQPTPAEDIEPAEQEQVEETIGLGQPVTEPIEVVEEPLPEEDPEPEADDQLEQVKSLLES